nr:MAG TPA: hypothetical protein [Bacteriophage sp.]
MIRLVKLRSLHAPDFKSIFFLILCCLLRSFYNNTSPFLSSDIYISSITNSVFLHTLITLKQMPIFAFYFPANKVISYTVIG